MKLKITYDSMGTERIYREDENGKQYLYYKDKKERVILRDLTEEDAVPLANAMKLIGRFCRMEEKQLYIKSLKEVIKAKKEDAWEFSLIATTLSGKVLGEIMISPVKDAEGYEAEIFIALKDDATVEEYAINVIRAIWNLHQREKWYDAIYLKDKYGKKIEMQLNN